MAMTAEEREAFLERTKAEFDARLARIAADPSEWVTFIEEAAIFGAHYSLHNQFLLMLQAAERNMTPRYFLPYGNKQGTSGWKAVNRHVRQGETAFLIWAPVKRRPTEEQAREWEAAGRTVRRDPDGRPAIQVVGFRPTTTFDISQTDGEPFEVPTVQRRRQIKVAGGRTAQLLTGDDPTGAYDDVVGLITQAGYDFALVSPGSPHLGSANGVTVKEPGTQAVRVRDDVSGAQRVKTSLHELAHIRCGHLDNLEPQELLHRGRRETEAESVAHLVCRALGLDTQAYSDAYVLGWADGDLTLIAQCAEIVLRIAKQILTDLAGTPDAAEATQPVPGAHASAAAGPARGARRRRSRGAKKARPAPRRAA
ncbi:ArdC family protein [Micromonospora sp. WMMD1082]|uniref:ArdC family protein n=1 Tax=Micromonospora sp. WMMD1082 TaxID=3016104 RepID=UPI002417733C|nr:ArdC family protein [Micromonospora sp. WMMD1082]MDG4795422.1 ArdC family protein [Micromonospora sp. WMMD1082]